ncbi:MAG: hypothetical protein KC620_01535, partial [Myxococcales bacterium]|nr:hypothetical protein [Myxococcales bacterium]
MRWGWALCLCWVWAIAGCDDGGGGDNPPVDRGVDATRRDGAVDDAGRDAAPDAAPDEGPGDRGPDALVDAEVDAAPVDMAPPLHIESCEDACNRVAACERFDIFGDEQACLDACARSSRRSPPTTWFECLSLERNCNLIQLCRLPAPPPLECAETCAAVADCGVEVPFPDCEAECAARNGDDALFSSCGEPLIDGACHADRFWSCLGEQVYTRCDRRCAVSVECNLVRPDGCLQGCVGESFDEDALRRRRSEQRTQCVSLAGMDCARIDACLNPAAEPVVADHDTFCRLWDGCALNRFFGPCDDLWDFGREQPGFAECVVNLLRDECPADPEQVFNCFDGGGGPVGPSCAELCEARDLCGALPAGQDRQGCLTTCFDQLGRGGDGADRLRLQFPCGAAESCPEFFECAEA